MENAPPQGGIISDYHTCAYARTYNIPLGIPHPGQYQVFSWCYIMTEGENKLITSRHWENKVSNHNQMGGIETSLLNNGNGKGTRVAWVDTGCGLRFKVVIDRAMDIAEAFFGKYSLAWLSHLGVTPPNPAAIQGATWLQSFGGGLLTTCGLTHVGGPEKDEYGVRGQHDRISHVPATIESIKQPDLTSGDLEMRITGRMIQSTVFGPHLELKRTISAQLGVPVIHIHDEVTNLGNSPAPHMLLYHINFGWPLVDTGAEIMWEGTWEAPNEQSRAIFNSENDYKHCLSPINEHSGNGEAVAFIDVAPKEDGTCKCGIKNEAIGLGVDLEFYKSQLPWLTNWQHWGKKEYVTALEPCTNPPIGQAAARANDTLIRLEEGTTRTYDTKFTVQEFSSEEIHK